MFLNLRNKLENVARRNNGKEPVDKKITDILHGKHAESYGLNDIMDAHFRIQEYLDDLELRKDLLERKTVLDIGSNSHFFDEYCQEKYKANVISLDISEESLGNKHPLGVVGDAKNLPFKTEAFDLVISHASMPHLFVLGEDENGDDVPLEGEIVEKSKRDIFSLFQEIYRVLKVGGQARMSTFSEVEEEHYKKIFEAKSKSAHIFDYQIKRVQIIKIVLEEFEKQSGAQCIFKEDKNGGLIIIKKV